METEIKMDNQYFYCSCNCTLPSMTGSTECCRNCSNRYGYAPYSTKIEDTTMKTYVYAEEYEMEKRRSIYKVYDRNGYVATFNNIIDALTFIDACNSKYYNQMDWQYTIKRIDDSVKCAVEE